MGDVTWPQKTGELMMWTEDSRPWNEFRFRPDDIVVATWSKSGTTWVQQPVSQLVFSGQTEQSGQFMSPWPDGNFLTDELEMAEAQTHRRFLKTHLPIENLVYSQMVKYLYVARDGRDTFWSWHNHHMSLTEEILEIINSFPYQKGPPYTWPNPDVRQAFLDWLDQDGYPNASFFDHIRGWWEFRHLPNLMLVHFNDLKMDMRGEIERIAAFLEIEVADEAWPIILEHCSFGWMRKKAIEHEDFGRVFKRGGANFLHKGTNGRWRDVLTEDDLARYQAEVERRLTPDCARRLETGELPNADEAETT